MSTPLSEVIQYLSYDGPILIGQSIETIKVLLQEFGSMSITTTTTHALSLAIEFSNDGVTFDYKSENSLKSGSKTITSVILGKWCRIRLANGSRFNASVRMSTFCQTIPIAIQSQIETDGNAYPSVNVDNLSETLHNELKISQRLPVVASNFTYFTSTFGILLGPNRNLTQYDGGGHNSITSPTTVIGNTLCLSNIYNEPIGAYQMVLGSPVVSDSGNSIYLEFSCSFLTGGYTLPNTFGYDEMLVGMGYINSATGAIVDGIYLGYPSNAVSPNPIVDEICLVIYFNGAEISIPKSQWTFDRLDGRGQSEVVLNPQRLSTWRIRFILSGSIFLEMHNPSNNEWIDCERFQLENILTTTGILAPSFSFNTITRKTNASSGSLVINGCGPCCSVFALGVEAGAASVRTVMSYDVSRSVLGGIGVETEILSIRNGLTFNTFNNRSIIIPVSLYINISGGASSGIVRIYKNGTFVAPVWVVKDAIYEATETSQGFYTIGTGINVHGLLLGPNTTATYNFIDINAYINRGDTLTFTIQSAAASTATCLFNYLIST